jgi:hypothetical protein
VVKPNPCLRDVLEHARTSTYQSPPLRVVSASRNRSNRASVSIIKSVRAAVNTSKLLHFRLVVAGTGVALEDFEST